MKILHILKKPPDTNVIKLINVLMAPGDEAEFKPLFRGDINWERLVDDIFSYEKVICWW